MKDQTVNKLEGTVSTNLPIGGKIFNIWFRDGDSYLESQSALNVRAAEASAFRNICINLLGQLNVDSATCVLDIGANVGISSLVLGVLSQNGETITPISKIVSFEPEPLTFECLEKNSQFFPGLISTVNCALGERSGTLPFMRTPGSTSASHVVTDVHFSGATNELVKVERLDYYVEKLALPHVGLIKIDVEGHEKAVLLGGIGTIEKFNPWIFLEFNSWTLIAYGGINPRSFLEYLLGWFQIVSVVNKVTGVLEPIKSKSEALAFLHNNLVLHGCVDDLVLRLR